MFLIDTNVVSELRKIASGRADPRVAAWDAATPADVTYLSAISLLELEIGVARMEQRDARQGARLRRWLDERVVPSFQNRILGVDRDVIRRCAQLHVPAPRPEYDALLAATALSNGLTVVTRNTADFAPMGVALLNPWEPTA